MCSSNSPHTARVTARTSRPTATVIGSSRYYAQPQYAQPQYAQPYAQPQYAQPQYGQPTYAQPQYVQPQRPVYVDPYGRPYQRPGSLFPY